MGPTGTTLANLLANRGISVSIFEKQETTYPLPRAVHFDGEVMRVFQSIGLASEISEHSLVNKGMLFKDINSNIIIDWSRSQAIGPMGWYESYRFHQPDLENTLRRGLSRFKNVKINYDSEIKKISDNGNDVKIELSSGKTHTSKFLVGCDGAQSIVRKFLQQDLVDLGFKQRWLVIDTILNTDIPHLGDHTVQICDPINPMTYVRGTGKRRRWEMRLVDDTISEITPKFVWEKLSNWISEKDAQIERSAVYTFKSAISKKWSKGNVFLAGDAAHLMPPFMGQGMCAGIRDVSNLAWKLSTVINGADRKILNTYTTERLANVQEFIDLTVRLGKIINQTVKGKKEATKMDSIWPSLGPGLGPRTNLEGKLAPQFISNDSYKADDLSPTGSYTLEVSNERVLSGCKEWLNKNEIKAAIVRPDFYILKINSERNSPENLNSSFQQFYNDLLGLLPSRKFVG